MTEQIKFGEEKHFEFEIGPVTKNKDHLTASELIDFVEKVSAIAKKDVGASFILAKEVKIRFFNKTLPVGKLTVAYQITPTEIVASIFQSGKKTSNVVAAIQLVSLIQI